MEFIDSAVLQRADEIFTSDSGGGLGGRSGRDHRRGSGSSVGGYLACSIRPDKAGANVPVASLGVGRRLLDALSVLAGNARQKQVHGSPSHWSTCCFGRTMAATPLWAPWAPESHLCAQSGARQNRPRSSQISRSAGKSGFRAVLPLVDDDQTTCRGLPFGLSATRRRLLGLLSGK